ncbi:metal ABC transporter permease [Rubinisphaera sp.]|uniref:metal ABC transporter permease n=1 Tax=Rubinisphaera sp. TaxID=2024857 RepID=UPI000C101CB3|nr:metal ABC transporter permease [Rubinisphaera sp.]MBV11542.1 manganese ABC transporter [Rubinisphaera sp.]|tara:strand:- start:25277 stop:26137 length:861 start_codon:yes stop_codon:yes gene_type:complete
MLGLPYNTAIVLLGTALVGATCGIIGTFAVLRKRALTGDALAHASLPGVCVGYYLAGGQNLALQFAGAFLTGLLAVWIIRVLPRISKTRTETAVAGVLSVFFGAGIVLSRLIQNSGKFGGRAGFDAFLFGSPGSLLERDVYLIGGACLLTVVIIALTFRLSVGVTFDAEFLSVQGLPTNRVDWLQLLLLTTTIVVGLPAIGVVMIVALIITPAVTARLWSDRFYQILLISAGIGAGASAVGALLSSLDTRIPAGASTVLVCTACYLISLGIRQFARTFHDLERISN